jgi:peptide chain release factor 1
MDCNDKSSEKFRKRSESDFKIEWYSGTGCGGQNRNKIMSSCRLTHLPSGIVKTAQTRSRQNSLRLAKESLVAELDQQMGLENFVISNSIRSGQVGSGMRGDKIRTYRFQDDVVQDHQTGKRHLTSKVLSGHFDLLW